VAPAAMSVADERVRDISNSPAYIALDDFAKQGKMTPAQVELFKNQYQKLHEVVIATYSSEKTLLDKAKELKNLLEVERIKLEKKIVVSHNTQADIEVLHKEEKETGAELAEVKEERAAVDFELDELQKTLKEQQQLLEEKYAKSLADMEPIKKNLKTQIQELKLDIGKQEDAYGKEDLAVQDYLRKIDEAQKSIASTEKIKLGKRSEYNQAMGEPERLKSSIEKIEGVAKDLQNEADELLEEIRRHEAELNGLSNLRKTAIEETGELNFKGGTLIAAITKRKTNIDDIKRAREVEKQTASEAAERMYSMENDMKDQKENKSNHLEALNGFHKECERQKKLYEKLRRKRDTVTAIIPPLKEQADLLSQQLAEMKQQLKMQKTMLEEIKQDEELFISQYLTQEKLEEDTADVLTGVEGEGKTFEEQIVKLDREERSLQAQISKLSAQRELMAREASRATSLYRETKEDLKVKNLILMDLDKQTMETFQRLKTCSGKYEKMKNQRNKLANLTQSSAQALAEMKEKIKILQNEVEILRNESLARDRALAEEVRIHQQAQNGRDGLRVDQNKQQQYLNKKKEEETQQLMEIDKLNSIVNSAERQMINLRTDYAQAVDNRNKTGIQLIDRNDELCILYEKSNIQASILAHGEEEMRVRDDEIRFINLEEAELRRKIDIARRQIPSLTTYAATADTLRMVESELEQERQLTGVLVSKLETPGSEDERARQLGGLDPEPEQVAAKIEVLEERLNDKKEQLLEKELVLDEVSSLSDKLRMQAAESRGPTLDLAKKVNDYQSKIRTTTRKMMASVSELSMYQATAMKLEHQKKEQLADLDEARYRLNQGAPPTEDAEHEWYRMERDRVRRQEAMMERRNATDAMDATSSMPGMVRTTAEPRPNAYIPEEVGIPKPYGTMAPFKPSQSGANMRHMRKPVIKEIQL
jgi:chromosome segregation ATPase